MCRIIYIDDKYYLILTKAITPENIIDKFNKDSGMTPKSFADIYVKKIINSILSGAINLNEKYIKYYADEYDSFSEFLYKKELFDEDFIFKISLKDNEILWQLNFSYSIESLIGYENENLSIINQALGETINEN